MKYILSVLFLFFFFSGFTQIYQEMPQYGYRANRMSFDSTLQIPTVCGVPTLKSVVSVNRKAAIAFDSCNNKFYTYNPKTLTWSEVSGGGATPSLQDVATVGNYYVNDNGDTLRLNSYDAVLDIKHPIIWTNDIGGGTPNNILDFSYGPSWYENVANIKFGNNSNSLGEGYIEITDKQSYFKNEMSQRTIIQNAPSTYATIQTTYFPLMKGSIDTLATTEDIRNSAIDTANKWVNDVLKKNDSTITIYKGATATDITLTPSTTVASATRLTTIVYNNSGATITKGSVIYINGRHSSNLPTIALAKADSEDSSYATFALVQDDILNNNTGTIIQAGNISNLNLPTASFADGQVVYLSPTVAGGLTVDKTSVLAPNHIIKIGTITRAHPTFGSIEIRIENGWQMDELSDVQIPLYPNDSTLLQYSRVDSLWHSVGITNAIGSNYIKPSDTATMLIKYLRKTDTASLSSRINLKVNISDTATMLTPYLRNNTASATYLAKSDSTTYYTKYRSDTSRTNIYNALLGKQGTLTLTTTGTSGASTLIGNTLNIPQYSGGTSYTFSTGLTNTSGTITNNLSTGVAGGQSVVGGTAASNSLTLSSTSNATKGKLLFGTSAYDEVNNRLGIGTASPASFIDGVSTATSGTAYSLKHTQTALNASDVGDACLKLDYTISGSGAGNELVTRALFLYTNNNWITGNVSNMRVFNLASQTVASSNTTNLDQVYIESATGGAVTNFRAIHIANSQGTSQGGLVMNQLTGTNRAGVSIGSSILPSGVWSIYSSTSDKSYHAGNFLLNTTTDAGYKLDVNGTARVVTSLQTPQINGNTTSGGTLTLQSTSNATKGKILFGTSAYDEVNNRLGIGTASPAYKLDCTLYNGSAVRLVGGVGYNNGFIQTSYSNFLFSTNTYFDTTAGGFKYEKAGYAASVQAESNTGNILFNTAPSGSAAANATLDNRMIVFNGGNVAIGTNPTNAGYKLDVNGTARANQFQLSALNTAPATSTSTGTTGEIRIVNGFIYVCVATNTWQRATLSTF